MAYILWGFSFLSTIFAIFYYNFSIPNSALQQATLAAMTIVIIILPYCLARAGTEFDKITDNKKTQKLNEEINSIIFDDFLLHKISLLFKLTNIEHLAEPTYEQITIRLGYLKKLFDSKLISTEEYTEAKNYLLITLKDHLKQKLGS